MQIESEIIASSHKTNFLRLKWEISSKSTIRGGSKGNKNVNIDRKEKENKKVITDTINSNTTFLLGKWSVLEKIQHHMYCYHQMLQEMETS